MPGAAAPPQRDSAARRGPPAGLTARPGQAEMTPVNDTAGKTQNREKQERAARGATPRQSRSCFVTIYCFKA